MPTTLRTTGTWVDRGTRFELFLNGLGDTELEFVDCTLVREEEIEEAVVEGAWCDLLDNNAVPLFEAQQLGMCADE